jgi:D-amino-acid oxidase
MKSQNVLILGSGVSGLTTALKLLQSGHNVTIMSKEQSETTPHTSLNAYAMWVPVRIDSDERIERWANESFREFASLSHNPATGVVMRQIFVLRQQRDEPWYAGSCAVFRHAREGEISAQYGDAHVLDTAPVIDPSTFNRWLREQVLAAGGTFVQREVGELIDCPAEFPIVINCTGLGARRLAGDPGLFPERVQVVTVKANGFNRVVIDDDGPNKRACIVPHADYIKLGALFDGANESLDVDDNAIDDIIARCCAMAPDLKVARADVISTVRALRPERSSPRVESDTLKDGRTVVHNYGHDGMGYILSLGIAAEITRLVDTV